MCPSMKIIYGSSHLEVMWFVVLGLQKVDNDTFLKCAVCSLTETNYVCIYETCISVFLQTNVVNQARQKRQNLTVQQVKKL